MGRLAEEAPRQAGNAVSPRYCVARLARGAGCAVSASDTVERAAELASGIGGKEVAFRTTGAGCDACALASDARESANLASIGGIAEVCVRIASIAKFWIIRVAGHAVGAGSTHKTVTGA